MYYNPGIGAELRCLLWDVSTRSIAEVLQCDTEWDYMLSIRGPFSMQIEAGTKFELRVQGITMAMPLELPVHKFMFGIASYSLWSENHQLIELKTLFPPASSTWGA